MKNRKSTVLVLAVAALVAPASFLRAEDPPAKTTQGSLELGGDGTSVEGSPDKAMEYEPTGRYLPWKLLVSSHEHWGSLLVSSEGNGTNDQKHFLSLDVQRAVRVKGGYEEFAHRLPHDPMKNLTAAVADGKFVWNTDLAPGTDYSIAYSKLGGRAELQLPSLSVATLGLSYGEQRRVEIARALASEPSLLLLDEPTAGMNPVEVQGVANLIRQVAAEGHSVLLVEHNVRLVMDVCDQITVLNFGKVIAEGPPAKVAADPAVITAYLGSER